MSSPSENAYRPPASDEPPESPAHEPRRFDSAPDAVRRAALLYLKYLPVIVLLVLLIDGPCDFGLEWVSNNFVMRPAAEMRLARAVAFFADGLLHPALFFLILEGERTGQTPGLGRALGYGLRRWGDVLGAKLMANLWILGGFLMLLVPGFMRLVGYSLVAEVTAVERGTASRRPHLRSAELVKGHAWRLLGAYALALVPALVIGLGWGFLSEDDEGLVLSALVSLLIDLAALLVTLTGLVVFLDLKAAGGSGDWKRDLPWIAPEPVKEAEPVIADAPPA